MKKRKEPKTEKNNRRNFVKTAGLATAIFGLGGILGLETVAQTSVQEGLSDTKKPNVIIILCDQLRNDALGCYGNKFVNTPNIDRLAKNGFLFEHGISNTPVCTPARSNLLSGQYSRTCVGSRANEMSNVPGDENLGRNDRLKFPRPTLPEQFKKMGYKTAQIGKWHIDTRPSLLGFDESLVTIGSGSFFTNGSFSKNEGAPYPVPGFTTDHEITRAKEFISSNKNSERPFFLYYNIISPHMPILDVPYKYSHMYNPKEVPLRKNVWKNGVLAYDEQWFHIYMWQTFYNKEHQPVTAKASPDFTLRELTALYYGAVSWVDDTVGEIIQSLKDNGLENNTLIVFTSDHGDMLGSHHLWNKDRLYEESICIPMIYSWPGEIHSGTNNSQVASLIDIMPTLLDLCGGEIPGSVQGQSLSPVLHRQKNCLEQNYTFIETPLRAMGIRTPDYLYGMLMNGEDTAIEDDRYLFYDLQEDPYELNNLAKTGNSAALANEFREKLIKWDKETPRQKGVQYKPWAR